MATADTYCTHKELKRVYPQIDSFDTKSPIYGWTTTATSNLYVAHNSGLVTKLFIDGLAFFNLVTDRKRYTIHKKI